RPTIQARVRRAWSMQNLIVFVFPPYRQNRAIRVGHPSRVSCCTVARCTKAMPLCGTLTHLSKEDRWGTQAQDDKTARVYSWRNFSIQLERGCDEEELSSCFGHRCRVWCVRERADKTFGRCQRSF